MFQSIYPEDMEEAFAEARITIDHGFVVGARATGLAFAQKGPSTADLSLAMDTMWVIIAACLVLFMQAGFAMLEVGFSRMKNVGSVVAKILVNLAIAALLFWAFGFALAFGSGNALVGTEGWFLAGAGRTGQRRLRRALLDAGPALCQVPLPGRVLRRLAGHRVGHDAGADQVRGVRVFAIVFAGLIYPMVGHWIWGGGWLTELGMQDFAGSTVVHLSGAMAALAGTLLLGPRPRQVRRRRPAS